MKTAAVLALALASAGAQLLCHDSMPAGGDPNPCDEGVDRCVAFYAATDQDFFQGDWLLFQGCDQAGPDSLCSEFSNADDTGCAASQEQLDEDDDYSYTEGSFLCTTASLGPLTTDELLERLQAITVECQPSGAGSAALSVAALAAAALSYMSAQ